MDLEGSRAAGKRVRDDCGDVLDDIPSVKYRAYPLNMANHFHSQARRRIIYEVKCVYRSHNPLFIDPLYSCGVRMCVNNREYERSLDQLVEVRNRASTRASQARRT
jgi:hypothetical protein